LTLSLLFYPQKINYVPFVPSQIAWLSFSILLLYCSFFKEWMFFNNYTNSCLTNL
jgi:hypothetical protein